MSQADSLTRSVTVHRLERTHWAAVFTAECGFFSAARLRHLFPLLFPAPVEEVIIRENDDRKASYEHVAVNGMVEPKFLLNKLS